MLIGNHLLMAAAARKDSCGSLKIVSIKKKFTYLD